MSIHKSVIETYKGVVGDGFQIVELPAAKAIQKFQPKTATFSSAWTRMGGEGLTGKLNAVRTPTTPRGFGTVH